MYKVGILCLSDKGSKGEREDLSTQTIYDILEKNNFDVAEKRIISDDLQGIVENLKEMCSNDLSLIITTGGTGFSPRDNTPEATKAVIEKEVPGISEAIRNYSMSITKRAMLSRGVSGIRGNTLIINLPGSPKAVKESLEFIISEIAHGLDLIEKGSQECGR